MPLQGTCWARHMGKPWAKTVGLNSRVWAMGCTGPHSQRQCRGWGCCTHRVWSPLTAGAGPTDQEERTKAIEAFRDGKKDVLVATDVASKGLDFPAIQHVINYDMPEEIENYGE